MGRHEHPAGYRRRNAKNAEIVSLRDSERFLGGWSDDELHGGKGDDFIAGRSGDDDLFGGSGSDYLYGGTENDYLKAGTGEYEWVIAGQSGADIFANPGMVSSWSRNLIPIQRDVYYDDFNPQFDVEVLFWTPQAFTSIISTPFMSTRP
ncbi:calcium-binding protein [Novipirellula artificiosorum]|uniref:Leukotoxin n=1 Tax=Novipirellula artificiosorum TaxID=2528016 RepID=A0A5C6DA93_9BACT|nr:calcium-binding protein [Novipirellula artificiosorum]TWU32627.1 Leukotoxin [Novipirellula artificiosorum]